MNTRRVQSQLLGHMWLMLVLKSCKSVQESSEEVLYFKARQIPRQMYLSRFKLWSSTVVSIENYENYFFRFDFTHIHVYVFRLSFLTTLNIYKDEFRGRHTGCKLMKLDANVLCKHIVTGDNCPSSSFSWRSCCVCTLLGSKCLEQLTNREHKLV